MKNTIKAAARPIISCLVAVAVSCSAQLTVAGSISASARMQSTRTCSYSLELQKSVSARRDYLVALSAAQGGGAAAGGEVGAGYGQDSYRQNAESDEEPALNMFGFESRPEAKAEGIDRFSTTCLGCHDGVGAVAVTANVRNDPYRRHGKGGGSDHPIGMDYNRYAGASRNFKPVWNDGGKMIFINGKVGCLTCHDPLGTEKGHLVMSDRNSALCLTCHNK